MDQTQNSPGYHDETGLYEIRIKGHLEPRWADRFEGMTILLEEDGNTLLSGPVADQAALHGLIKKVRDLGMTLVSVNFVDPGRAKTQEVKAQIISGSMFQGNGSRSTKKEKKMKTYRMNAVMTGVLYFLGTVFGVSGGLIGGEVLTSLISGKPLAGVDMLGLVAANSSRLTWGAFLTLMMGISLVTMTVFLYPVMRKASKELAMGMVLFRGALEGIFYFSSALVILTLVALGNNYIASGADLAVLQSISNVLYQFENLKAPVSSIIFLIGATCIYIAFYRTRLIPRWVSVWGFIAVAASLASALLNFFHVDTGLGFYLEMVMFPQELVMAVWLIVKGFNPSAIAVLSAKKGSSVV